MFPSYEISFIHEKIIVSRIVTRDIWMPLSLVATQVTMSLALIYNTWMKMAVGVSLASERSLCSLARNRT